MDFKLVSKNNMGVVATLILILLLSQSKFFNFLIDNALGRAFLILFIIVISFVHKVLGVVAVLFVIIMFNQSNIGFSEGFTNPTKKPNTKLQEENTKLQQENNKLKQSHQNIVNTSSAAATTPNTSEGFNTVDREGIMLRGKRSSEIPVLFNPRNQSDFVEPTNTFVFSDTYSSF